MPSDQDASEKASILLGEAVLLRAQKKNNEALAKCLESLKLRPGSAEAFAVLGDLYGDSYRTEAAIEAYKRAIELDPASQSALEIKIAHLALREQKATQQRQRAKDLAEGKVVRSKKRSPATAGLLSLLVPGLGQVQNLQCVKAVILLLCWLVLFRTLLPNISNFLAGDLNALFTPKALLWTLLLFIIYGYSVIDAAMVAMRLEKEESDIIE